MRCRGSGCSFVQAAAAAQAGVSVIQPNIGRLGDWYTKHPGAIRNPKGPREDSGATSSENPGIRLAERIYAYVKQFHPKTRVMISGIRRKEGPVPRAPPWGAFFSAPSTSDCRAPLSGSAGATGECSYLICSYYVLTGQYCCL